MSNLRPEDAIVPGCATCTREAGAIRTQQAYLAQSARIRAHASRPPVVARADAQIARDKACIAQAREVLTAHLATHQAA